MVTEPEIDKIMSDNGYHIVYDNRRQKIWKNSNPRLGKKRVVTVPFPCAEDDLKKLLGDAGISP